MANPNVPDVVHSGGSGIRGTYVSLGMVYSTPRGQTRRIAQSERHSVMTTISQSNMGNWKLEMNNRSSYKLLLES